MEERPQLDHVSERFVRVIEIISNVGLIVMLLAGIAYFVDLPDCANPQALVRNWHKPASQFWMDTQQLEINGYSWFASDLQCAANISIVGMVIMMLAPFFAMLAAIPLSSGIYVVFFVLLAIEFVVAVTRPIISGG